MNGAMPFDTGFQSPLLNRNQPSASMMKCRIRIGGLATVDAFFGAKIIYMSSEVRGMTYRDSGPAGAWMKVATLGLRIGASTASGTTTSNLSSCEEPNGLISGQISKSCSNRMAPSYHEQ